jgi:hypothetical protein
MTSLPNFIKIYKLVQKLLEGDRLTGDLISLSFLFRESRLIKEFSAKDVHHITEEVLNSLDG